MPFYRCTVPAGSLDLGQKETIAGEITFLRIVPRPDGSPWLEATISDGTGSLVTLFFSEQLDDIARAKAICAECPVMAPCLEQAIIDNLQAFLLELGKGFSFVARQKRLSFEDEDFFVDLVFYNCIWSKTNTLPDRSFRAD